MDDDGQDEDDDGVHACHVQDAEDWGGGEKVKVKEKEKEEDTLAPGIG